MRFSLWMLSNMLRRHDIESEFRCAKTHFYSTVQLYTEGWSLWGSDILYVLDNGGQADGGDFPEDCGVVMLHDVGSSPSCNCLIITSECSKEELMNALLNIVCQFNLLEKQLLELAVERDSFSSALSILSRFMKNPAYAMDSRFKLLAIDIDEDLIYSSITLKRLKEQGYMPIQTVVRILENRTWTQVHETASPVLVMMEEFYLPFINCAIRYNDHFQGYLIVVGLNHSLNQGDVDLVEQIMPAINRIALVDAAISTGRGSYYENFLLDVIRGTLQNQILIAEQLKPLGWKLHDRYACIVCHPDPERVEMNETFLLRASHIFSGKPLLAGNDLYCVFRLSPETSCAEMLRTIDKLCRSCKYKVGVSDIFPVFTDLYTQVQNADRALSVGLSRSPDRYIYPFPDYRLYCLFDIVRSRVKLNGFIPPELRMLEKYDLENDTDLVHTLYVFLRKERNWVDAAEALHIHRNTLRYRIDRLTELTGVDLEDEQKRWDLLFAYEVKKFDDLFPQKERWQKT